MDQIAIRKTHLPQNIEDLSKFVLVGREKLTAVRAEIRAIDKLGLADDVRRQKLEEAQMISEAVLDAEIRIGALSMVLPKVNSNQHIAKAQTDSSVVLQKTKTQAVKELGFTPKQIERFEALARNPEIVEQAKVEARENEDIVSRSFVLEKIKTADRLKQREEIKIATPGEFNGKYDVLYADPPWQHGSSGDSRATENHYPTMTLDEIKSVKIPAADNAVLYLWATAPLLLNALEVMETWGFTYKSQMVWDKEIIGMGFWARGQHEILLIGTKGNFSPPPPELRVSSVYREKRTAHSKKPDYYCDIIERMFPNGRFLELFARRQYSDKWDVWGNQV